MKDIPIHNLTQPDHSLDIMRLPEGNTFNAEADKIHRDDHYNIFALEKGTMPVMIDFQNASFEAGGIYCILPGQIHRRTGHRDAKGWFLAPDHSLVTPAFRRIFESHFEVIKSSFPDPSSFKQCLAILTLLNERCKSSDSRNAFQKEATASLFHSFLCLTADGFTAQKNNESSLSRQHQLRYKFRHLLVNNFRSLKSASDYAEQLHVSVNYLNEVIKKCTGFPVSYWILYEIILEAKRLLIYTNLTAKEISYQLGYTDPAYFSKLFKKNTAESPLSFRIKTVNRTIITRNIPFTTVAGRNRFVL